MQAQQRKDFYSPPSLVNQKQIFAECYYLFCCLLSFFYIFLSFWLFFIVQTVLEVEEKHKKKSARAGIINLFVVGVA